jgi:outer membrane receptor protein involved in Fe transport
VAEHARGALVRRAVEPARAGLVLGSVHVGAPGDLREACVQEYDSKTLVDAEAGYRVSEWFQLAIGGRNLFDEFPDRAIFDNSFGIFNFPSASPFGFNGRYLYVRTEIEAPW